MPLEIDVNVKAPSILIMNSKTIELIALIHMLTDMEHHEIEEQWVNQILSNMSEKSKDTINILGGFRLKGIEFIEFILKHEIFSDVNLLINTAKKYDEVEFIYTFLGEEISVDKILETRSNITRLNMLTEEMVSISEVNLLSLKELFYHTENFKIAVLSLLLELNNIEFSKKLNTNHSLYNSVANDIKERLLDKRPMELVNEIMGRKCKVTQAFKKFYFIPCYFLSPHRIRFFNDNIQILVFDISKYCTSKKNIGDKLSNVLKIISDRTRLEILKELINGSSYGKLLAQKLNLTTSTISHHIEQLKAINLVTEERRKNIKYFSANTIEVENIFGEVDKYLFAKKHK